MNLVVLANVAVFVLAMVWLYRRRQGGATVSSNVLISVLLGAALGAAVQGLYGFGTPAVTGTMTWVGVVGGIYVRLLQMIIAPLVLFSILSAVTKLNDTRSLGKISAGVLGMLIATTAAASIIGIVVTNLFGLRADGLVRGARELERGAAMEARVGDLATINIPSLLQSFVPTNIVADLAGTRSTSVMGVVVFAAMLGFAVLMLRKDNPELGDRVLKGIETFQALVLRLVRMVLRLTPYGVLALMTRVVATSNVNDILDLGGFVIASYVGLALILLMHAGILALAGLSPLRFYRKIWPTLTFAFTSRSSAATIPLSVETQVSRLGVSPAIANFAASFGATIGQNACAGLYPSMLAIMIAPSVGIDPLSFSFLSSVVAVATIGSIGIAGVGGGATFAALVVLSSLNLPVALAGLLISVEPLIDMGRTAVNVSGSMTAGTVTSRWLGQTNMAVFTAPDPVGVVTAEGEDAAVAAAAAPARQPAPVA
ncbi:MAG TPA: cation:dicarboxylase symporter family transporter [Vicinamibacterales bacterium]|nr:cation:dicarboxylase symporter family transporter [Vicinamibacterales bacterium]